MQFKSKKEYEKWKTERAREIKDNPNKIIPKTEKEISQQAKLQEYKSSNRKINCPACNNSISVNAEACPKCGQPISDTSRIDGIAKSNINQIIFAVFIIVVSLFFFIGNLLSDKHESNSSEA